MTESPTALRQHGLAAAVTLHAGSIIACALLYSLLPQRVHLRWGLGYLAVWIMLLSPLLLIAAAKGHRRRVWIRLYGALMAALLWSGAFLANYCGADVFLPATSFCRDGDYIVRRWYGNFFSPCEIAVYKTEGMLERPVNTYTYSNPDPIRVHEPLNVIVIYCNKTTYGDPWNNYDSTPVRVIDMLYPNPISHHNMLEKKKLSHKLKVKIADGLTE